MEWLPVLVAVLGLFFAVGSFWWFGRLEAFEPATYAMGATARKAVLLWPLVIVNTGPRSVGLLNVRLDVDQGAYAYSWQRIRSGVSPSHADLLDMSSPRVLPGGQTTVIFAEFEHEGSMLQAGDHRVRVEVSTTRDPAWQELGEFTLGVSERAASENALVSYTNIT